MAACGLCVQAWCESRQRWIIVVDVGICLGEGDSTFAECYAGVQAYCAAKSLLSLRCVDLKPDCTAADATFDSVLANILRIA